MITEKRFPTNQIIKNSSVILYGAGKVGRELWEQNQSLKWCNICCVVDSNYQECIDFPQQVYPVEMITKYKFDYVLVSPMIDSVIRDIKRNLHKYKIDNSKIIYCNDFLVYKEEKPTIVDEESDNDEKLTFAFYSALGGIGDHIISLKVYQELCRIVPECIIDVFSNKVVMAKSIFWGQQQLNNIHDITSLKSKIQNYDVVLEVKYDIRLIYMKKKKLSRVCPELARRMTLLCNYQEKKYVNLNIEIFTDRIIIDRAKRHNKNRYTMFADSGAFDIEDQHVDVLINECYRNRYEELNLSAPYITYNYGAAEIEKYGCNHTKMWPSEYHEKLNQLMKKTFPEINIVQIGAEHTQRIKGADAYIIGEDLEVTKMILKNAIFHFDCEGGLVHLATAIGTKCFVVFGPTPVWFYGYPQNCNILPQKCGECIGLTKDWQFQCYEYCKPECMCSIEPEYVFTEMQSYLERRGHE